MNQRPEALARYFLHFTHLVQFKLIVSNAEFNLLELAFASPNRNRRIGFPRCRRSKKSLGRLKSRCVTLWPQSGSCLRLCLRSCRGSLSSRDRPSSASGRSTQRSVACGRRCHLAPGCWHLQSRACSPSGWALQHSSTCEFVRPNGIRVWSSTCCREHTLWSQRKIYSSCCSCERLPRLRARQCRRWARRRCVQTCKTFRSGRCCTGWCSCRVQSCIWRRLPFQRQDLNELALLSLMTG